MPLPWWKHPIHRQVHNESDGAKIARALSERGFPYLKVVGRGDHLVVYSEEDGLKTNRIRFTRVGLDRYQLGFANHRGNWQGSPFEGSVPELVDLVLEQFAFTLTEL